MPTDNLHHTLSPQAHAELYDAMIQSARRERRLAVQAFRRGWGQSIQSVIGRLARRIFRLQPPMQPRKA